jgi:hypothetical protein
MEAAFIPEVNDELDTQNFEKFEEVRFYLYDAFLYRLRAICLAEDNHQLGSLNNPYNPDITFIYV